MNDYLAWTARTAQRAERRRQMWDKIRGWFWIAFIIGILVYNHWGPV